MPKLNLLIITADVAFQEYDENGKPYEQIIDGKLLKFESKARDLSDFLYLKGSMHRDPEDGLLYVTKRVTIDKENNIIGIRKVITETGKEIGKLLYNDPIMIRDIEEMTTTYKNEMVKMAKKVLKPSVYDDTRHILENLRAIPEPGGSLSVSYYAVKRRQTPAVTEINSANILRIDDYRCSLVSLGNVVGRVNQNRSDHNTGVDEGRDSFMSRLRFSLRASTLTSVMARFHTTVSIYHQGTHVNW